MLRTLILALLILIPALRCLGQEVFYFGANMRPLDSQEEAMRVMELYKPSKSKFLLVTKGKTASGWKETEFQKIKLSKEGELRIRTRGAGIFQKRVFRQMTPIGQGQYSFTETAKGKVLRSGTSSQYLPLLLEGKVTEYHPNGLEKSLSTFHNNQLISNQNWLSDGKPYIDDIFYITDQPPIYQPGDARFKNHLLEGISEAKLNLDEYEDEVIIGWVVMETGQMEGVIALQGKSSFLNQTLVDIIAGIPGDWMPAFLDDRPVRYFMSIPITISHQGANFQDLDFSMGILHYNKY